MSAKPKSVEHTDIKRWAIKITTAWQKTVNGIFEVCRLLVAARAALKDGEHGKFKALIRELPFGYRTAYMLIAIAEDKRLVNHGSKLPPSWRTLYELTRLDEAEFKFAIAHNLIQPEMERWHVGDIHSRYSFENRPQRTQPSAAVTTEPAPTEENVIRLGGDPRAPLTPNEPPPAPLVAEYLGPRIEKAIATLDRMRTEFSSGFSNRGFEGVCDHLHATRDELVEKLEELKKHELKVV